MIISIAVIVPTAIIAILAYGIFRYYRLKLAKNIKNGKGNEVDV